MTKRIHLLRIRDDDSPPYPFAGIYDPRGDRGSTSYSIQRKLQRKNDLLPSFEETIVRSSSGIIVTTTAMAPLRVKNGGINYFSGSPDGAWRNDCNWKSS